MEKSSFTNHLPKTTDTKNVPTDRSNIYPVWRLNALLIMLVEMADGKLDGFINSLPDNDEIKVTL